MFDIGFTELLVIGVVALIVIGPKDLPGMFRTLGRFTARARQMARELSSAMNQAADDMGAKDVAETFKSATSPKSTGLDALSKAADEFEKWDPNQALKNSKVPPRPELDEDRADMAKKIHDATAKAKQATIEAPSGDGKKIDEIPATVTKHVNSEKSEDS